MSFKRNKLISLTLYIVCIILYLLATIYSYQLIIKVNTYFLIILIPLLILFLILSISSILKLVIIIISLLFGINNEDFESIMDKYLEKINKFTKYSLEAILLAFLSSIMILDIILCINTNHITLAGVSIAIWIVLYYLLFNSIINQIKSDNK